MDPAFTDAAPAAWQYLGPVAFVVFVVYATNKERIDRLAAEHVWHEELPIIMVAVLAVVEALFHSDALGVRIFLAVVAFVLGAWGYVAAIRRKREAKREQQEAKREHAEREVERMAREAERDQRERERDEQRERDNRALMEEVRSTLREDDEQPKVAPNTPEAEAVALVSDLLRMVKVHEVTDPFFPYYQMQQSPDPAIQERARELMRRDLSEHHNHTLRMTGLYLHRFKERVSAVTEKLLPKNNGGFPEMNAAIKRGLPLSETFIRQIAAYLSALAGAEVYGDAEHERAEARAVEHGITVAAIHRENHEHYMRQQRRERDNLWKRARDTVWKIENLTIPLKRMAGQDKGVFAAWHRLDIMDAADPVAKMLATGEPQRVVEEEQRKALALFRREVWDDLEPMLGEFAEFGIEDKVSALANGEYFDYDNLGRIAEALLSMNTALKAINLND